jgi:hypothetical protein
LGTIEKERLWRIDMPDIPDADFVEVSDKAGNKYFLAHLGPMYSCTCAAWKEATAPQELRTCKHLKQYLGAQSEERRIKTGSGSLKPGGAIVSERIYREDILERAEEPTTIEQFVLAFENELDLKLDRYSAPRVVYFRSYANAFLELDSYPDPDYEVEAEPGFPPEMFVRRATFVQQEHNIELAELVEDVFAALGWRQSDR